MCLTIDKFKNQYNDNVCIPTTADKDIEVWKVGCVYTTRKYLLARKSYKFEQIFYPRYHASFEYRSGIITPKEDLIVSDGKIYRGYHAFVNKTYVDLQCLSFENVERFIIPKGAQYFIGEEHDIVATQLVWKPKTQRD